MTLLEDRLAAAGDQLDDLIETHLDRSAGHARGVTASATGRVFTVAACLTVVLGFGLAWAVRDGGRAQPAIAPTTPTASAAPETDPDAPDRTTAATGTIDTPTSPEQVPIDQPATTEDADGPGTHGCGFELAEARLAASAIDVDGRTMEYFVVERPDFFGEVVRTVGSDTLDLVGCTSNLDTVKRALPWASPGTIGGASSPFLMLRGRAAPGVGLVDVTLQSGSVVRVVPAANGWFLSLTPIVLDDDPTSITVTSVVEVVGGSGTQPTTTAPVALRPPVAIGESVMLGAVPQLQAGGFVVDASESRLGDQTADVIGRLRAAGQLGKVVVIQVGTNGPVSQATLDLIMSYLPAEDVPTVRFLTVHADGRSWIEPNNDLIWGLKATYRNVDVLDWNGLVSSGQVPGMADDGIHLGTPAAKQFYANSVFGVIGRNDLVQPLPVD